MTVTIDMAAEEAYAAAWERVRAKALTIRQPQRPGHPGGGRAARRRGEKRKRAR